MCRRLAGASANPLLDTSLFTIHIYTHMSLDATILERRGLHSMSNQAEWRETRHTAAQRGRRRAHFRRRLREQCQCFLYHPRHPPSLIKPAKQHPLSPTADRAPSSLPQCRALLQGPFTLYHELQNVNDGVAARLRQRLRRCKSAVTAAGAERGMRPAQALCAGERCDQTVR